MRSLAWHRLRALDWDAVAGVAAAVVALVLHLLHVASGDVLLTIILVILALILIRDLRRESREEDLVQVARATASDVRHLATTLVPPDVLLVGPSRLRVESERFGREARGEMTWFYVCLLMFEPQALFDTLLRPAVENPNVTAVQFILSEGASSGTFSAHVSFWGEPFMARAAGRAIRRYIFHVQPHSELIGRLVELARQYRRGGMP